MFDRLRRGFGVRDHPVDPIAFSMEVVIACFKADIQKNQKAGGHAYSEAEDIYKRKTFVSPKVSECGSQIVFEHKAILMITPLQQPICQCHKVVALS